MNAQVPTLSNAFRDAASRVSGTIVFLDIANSSEMKAESEANWLNTVAVVMDTIQEKVDAVDGCSVVKYLGDGAMLFFAEDQVTAAINFTISIQEALKEKNDTTLIKCRCSAGIATVGSTAERVTRFSIGSGVVDYIGLTVDRAFRLCAAGSANSIIVDYRTIENCVRGRIVSSYGRAIKREADAYIGDVITVPAKGFPNGIKSHEIMWDIARSGLKGAVLETSNKEQPATENRTAAKPAGHWVRGRTLQVKDAGRFCFIEGEMGERLYTQPSFFADQVMTDEGDLVFFVPVEARKAGDSRIAQSVIALGRTYSAVITNAPEGKSFVFAKIDGIEGPSVYCTPTRSGETWRAGQRVQVLVGESFNKKTDRMDPSCSVIA